MFVPSSFAVALLMTIVTAICWGSWANTFKGTKNYRFELFYFDYGLGIFVVSVVLALTMGSRNGGVFSFLPNLRQAEAGCLLYALAGGFIFNIANVLLVAAIEMVGLAIAFPLSIGIALVEGTVVSYLIHPGGNATLLFAGVGMALLAVIFIGKAYAVRGGESAVATRKGIVLCLVSGVLMGSWAPLLSKALNGTGANAEGLAVPAGALSPYTAAVFMTLGAFVCCFVFNPLLMRKPLIGEPVSFAGYFAAPGKFHAWGLLGGFIWGAGTVFNLVAGGKVGVPISYAIGQSAPMIATFWGVFLWHEFRGASAKSKGYLGAMFAAYVLAIALISRAYAA